LGKYKFVHIRRGGIEFVKDTFSGEGIKAIAKLCIIYVFVAMFWALFDQSQSAWVLQAEKMELKWLGIGWLPAQVQFVNSLFIMILIPLFSYVIYPAIGKVFPLTALRKIGIGLFVGVLSFVVPAWVEGQIDGGDIFKCSSRSTIAGLEPVRLIDGLTDGSGWSSDKAPSPEAPTEIVIRLRERKAWSVSSVEVDPVTRLSYREIVSMLDELALDTLRQIKRQRQTGAAQSDIGALQRKVDQIKAAAGRAKKAAKQALRSVSKQQRRSAAARAAKDVAMTVMTEHGAETTCLDDSAYSPKEIAVFAGDFSDRLLPTPLFELSDKDRADIVGTKQYAVEAGWTHLGDYSLDRAEQNVSSINLQDFGPIQATHIMLQIKSNYGAERVKIAEVSVQTNQAIAAESKATAGEVWPNVAALGYKPSVGWQFFAYLILTAAEIMVSITCLEFSYTQAPKKMKSFIMAVYLLSISLGNFFTAAVNAYIQNADGSTRLPGADYYWFFTIAMLVTAVVFIPIARRYPVKNYIQDEAVAE
ncbi:MAG: hypothetical protein JSW59_04620, partial [Phycisphaerales bacterium]